MTEGHCCQDAISEGIKTQSDGDEAKIVRLRRMVRPKGRRGGYDQRRADTEVVGDALSRAWIPHPFAVVLKAGQNNQHGYAPEESREEKKEEEKKEEEKQKGHKWKPYEQKKASSAIWTA